MFLVFGKLDAKPVGIMRRGILVQKQQWHRNKELRMERKRYIEIRSWIFKWQPINNTRVLNQSWINVHENLFASKWCLCSASTHSGLLVDHGRILWSSVILLGCKQIELIHHPIQSCYFATDLYVFPKTMPYHSNASGVPQLHIILFLFLLDDRAFKLNGMHQGTTPFTCKLDLNMLTANCFLLRRHIYSTVLHTQIPGLYI